MATILTGTLLYISCNSPHFDGILMWILIPIVALLPKSKFQKFKMADGRVLKIVFSYVSALYCLI